MVIKTRADKFYNKTQLRMGIKVEMEHTTSRIKAKKIAKQHLEEIPDYYSRLRKMEQSYKKTRKNRSRKKRK